MIQTLIVAGAAGALGGAKRRAALAMLFGDIGSMLLPALSLPDRSWVVGAYMLLDLVSAAIILQHPIGRMQQAIGLLFAIMVMFHIGFLVSLMLSVQAPSTGLYWSTQVYVGWTQVGLLISWGVYDAFRNVLDRRWSGGFALRRSAGNQ